MASSAPLSKANTSFCLDLFKQLSDNDKTANVFFSPFSISSALAMVMLGARGNTQTQMSEVLCFIETLKPNQANFREDSPMQSQMQTRLQFQTQLQQQSRLPNYLRNMCMKPQDGQDDVHTSFNQLLSTLNVPDIQFTLSIANRLYGEQSYQFVKDFLEETRKHYEAELESVDFQTSSEEARVNINSWVEEQTQGKIKDLLAKDVVDSATVLVLINAIYFKGSWDKRFEVDSTVDAAFRINKNDTKPVKMMCQKSEFTFTSIPEINCQILEMPYKGKDLSILIFLPNEIEDDTTGLERLEKELTYEKFVEWTRRDLMGQTKVEVRLPRFKMEETYNLNDVLKGMGMVDAFDVAKSDFSGMSPANNVVLSKVVHKSFVEVNEEGTKAAATSAAVLQERSNMIPATFIADHPFLFFIQHNTNKAVLFAGRFCSPE
nr:PREDICTED: leukocyte elastase inhibitor-like [Paralichthys olivaceus]XP_019943245.1 PREDICTED: leukocyte elastase inhibitor-like [Paralichthys olivaceus]